VLKSRVLARIKLRA